MLEFKVKKRPVFGRKFSLNKVRKRVFYLFLFTKTSSVHKVPFQIVVRLPTLISLFHFSMLFKGWEP